MCVYITHMYTYMYSHTHLDGNARSDRFSPTYMAPPRRGAHEPGAAHTCQHAHESDCSGIIIFIFLFQSFQRFRGGPMGDGKEASHLAARSLSLSPSSHFSDYSHVSNYFNHFSIIIAV